MARKRILVTGGAGFIGTHFTLMALATGHQVRVLDNLSQQIHGNPASFEPHPDAEFIRGDVNVREDLERALQGVDTVIHLAAETGTGQSMYEIDRYYRVNVQGTALLFDILANATHGVSNFVLASSRSVYGEGAYLCHECDPDGARRFPGGRSIDQLQAKQWTPSCPECGSVIEPAATREDDIVSPASIYAATKLAQEDIARIACRALGISHAILRLQNVFGEGQSLKNPYTGIISIFSTKIRLGQTLPIFEDGEESRDFIHISDVAEAILRCVDNPVADGITVNVGFGERVSILAMARLLQRVMGSPTEVRITEEYRVGDIRHNFADISTLRNVLGFHPKMTLEAGIKRFCEWVQQQPIETDLLDKANAELKDRKLMA